MVIMHTMVIFVDFVDFLSMVIQVMLFHIHNVYDIILAAPGFQILEYQLVNIKIIPNYGSYLCSYSLTGLQCSL